MKRIEFEGKVHEFPDDFTDTDISAALAQVKASPAVVSSRTTPLAARAAQVPAWLANMLPAGGGMAGAAMGAPLGPLGAVLGGIGGAMAGGAAGEAGREAATGQAIDPGQIAREGGMQGVYQAAGGLAARPLSWAARNLMRGAARIPADVYQYFPDVVETLLKERIPLGDPTRRAFGIPGGRTGTQIAAQRMGAAVAPRDVMLDTAEQAGIKLDPGDMLKHVDKLIRKTGNSRLKVNEKLKVLGKELDDFLRDNPGKMTPNEAKALKQAAQDEAQAAYAARSKGQYLKGDTRLQEKFNAALARGVREEMEKAIPKRGKTTFQQAEKRVQSLTGAQQAVARARPQMAKGAPAQMPLLPTWGVGFVPPALRPMNAVSRTALFLDDPRFLEPLRQTPRWLDYFLTPPESTP